MTSNIKKEIEEIRKKYSDKKGFNLLKMDIVFEECYQAGKEEAQKEHDAEIQEASAMLNRRQEYIEDLKQQLSSYKQRITEIIEGLDDMFLSKATMNYSKKGDTWTILKQDWNKIVKELLSQIDNQQIGSKKELITPESVPTVDAELEVAKSVIGAKPITSNSYNSKEKSRKEMIIESAENVNKELEKVRLNKETNQVCEEYDPDDFCECGTMLLYSEENKWFYCPKCHPEYNKKFRPKKTAGDNGK